MEMPQRSERRRSLTNRDDSFRDKFRTQSDALTGVVSYVLRIPSALWFIAEVADSLTALVIADNWQQIGTVTVDEAIEAASAMLETFKPMIGFIFPVATAAFPDNMLPCDGATYNREDYPNLYAVLDSAFIVDADTFVTPNLTNRTVVGAGDLYDVGETFGEATHTLITDEIPAHTHTDSGHSHPIALIDGLALSPGELPVIVPEPPPFQTYFTGGAQANLENTGGGASHNNIQPSTGLRYGIIAQ